jgi:hypothetical protein
MYDVISGTAAIVVALRCDGCVIVSRLINPQVPTMGTMDIPKQLVVHLYSHQWLLEKHCVAYLQKNFVPKSCWVVN